MNLWYTNSETTIETIIMSAQQRMKIANEKASKNITNRGNVVKGTVSKPRKKFYIPYLN